MRVLRGGSAELVSNKWFKFDVELDESDLQAMVMSYGLDADKLSVIDKYRLLSKQSELLVTVEMERQGSRGEFPAKDIKVDLENIINNLPKVG